MIRFYEIVQDDGEMCYSYTASEGCTIFDGVEITMAKFLEKNKYPARLGRNKNISIMEFEDLINEHAFSAPKE